MKRAHVAELEGVRAIAAWWVVAGHFAYVFSDRLGGAIHPRWAVLVFITLSGYLVTGLLRERSGPLSAYFVRRVFRLWPAYLVALALSAATLTLQRAGISSAPVHPAEAVFRIGNIDAALAHLPANVFAHLFMAHGLVPEGLLPRTDVTILGQAWSLSVEAQFYVAAPFVVYLIDHGSGRSYWRVLTPCVFGAALLWLSRHGPLASNGAWVGHYVVPFGLGIAASYMRAERVLEHRALRWLGSQPLVWLGKRSYSTYLFHTLALFIGMAALAPLHLQRWPFVAALFGLTVLGTLMASWVSFRWLEEPARLYGQRLARRMSSRTDPALELMAAP